jgi:hypothetical protein
VAELQRLVKGGADVNAQYVRISASACRVNFTHVELNFFLS